MARHVLQIHCPCCGKPLEIDTRTGKVRKMAVGPGGLDDLLSAQKSETERLDGLFDSAREQHSSEQDRLDDLFKKARKDAENDDDKPRSPFDLE